MRPARTIRVAGHRVELRPCDGPAPLVCLTVHDPMAERLLGACRDEGCPPFHLLEVTGLRWDEELSPWPSDPVLGEDDRFAGEAPGYLALLLDEVLPEAERLAEQRGRVVAGYSMGGLFALWAAHACDAFRAAVSASGSVWYPGFADFALSRPLSPAVEAAYLSIGDRESRTRNPVLRTTEEASRRIADAYARSGVRATFALEPGDHFRDVAGRCARGIAWALRALGGRRDAGA